MVTHPWTSMVLLQIDSSTDDESRKPESEQTQLLFSTQTTGQCERNEAGFQT